MTATSIFRRPRPSKLALLGLLLSLYAVYVEHKMETKEEGEEFTALCDIKQIGASCSAVFALPEGHLMSYFGLVPHGHILDVPNAAIGVAYYLVTILLRPFLPVVFTRIAATAAMSASFFLAYRLTQLGEICVLCWTTHVLNAFLLFSAFVDSPSLRATAASKQKRV